MSDIMLLGVLRMPYEMAMSDEMSRLQFHSRAQEAADRILSDEAEIARLTAERDAAMAGRVKVKPLDLANLLKHAFFSGRASAGGSSATHGEAWVDYDPTVSAAYARILAALQPDTERAEPVAGALFIDQDGDVCINDGRKNNLVFCPAADEDGKPLCPDVVAAIISRFNSAQPAPAPQAREVTVQGAAEIMALMAAAFEAGAMAVHREWVQDGSTGEGPPRGVPDFSEAAHDYAALRVIAAMQKGGDNDR